MHITPFFSTRWGQPEWNESVLWVERTQLCGDGSALWLPGVQPDSRDVLLPGAAVQLLTEILLSAVHGEGGREGRV